MPTAETKFPDMNDFAYFAAVVRHGGFSAAGRVLGLPKSKLSRHISALEDRLGVRLIERTVHRFRVTEIGQLLYVYCENMLREVERATRAVGDANGDPQGTIRLGVPTGLVEGALGGIFPEFLLLHPKIQLQIIATDQRMDIINDRLDLAIRAQLTEETDTELTMRVLSKVDLILVANKEVAARLPEAGGIEALASMPTVSFTGEMAEWRELDVWEFVAADGTAHKHEHRPRMICRSVPAVLQAIHAGVGVGLLPEIVCAEGLRDGSLVRLLPEYQMSQATIYIVFTASRGLPTAVRTLVDFLVERFRTFHASAHSQIEGK
jgi:DNA-binding transcriptional LysR family regulator